MIIKITNIFLNKAENNNFNNTIIVLKLAKF